DPRQAARDRRAQEGDAAVVEAAVEAVLVGVVAEVDEDGGIDGVDIDERRRRCAAGRSKSKSKSKSKTGKDVRLHEAHSSPAVDRGSLADWTGTSSPPRSAESL